jgi:hypothetical protein
MTAGNFFVLKREMFLTVSAAYYSLPILSLFLKKIPLEAQRHQLFSRREIIKNKSFQLFYYPHAVTNFLKIPLLSNWKKWKNANYNKTICDISYHIPKPYVKLLTKQY